MTQTSLLTSISLTLNPDGKMVIANKSIWIALTDSKIASRSM